MANSHQYEVTGNLSCGVGNAIIAGGLSSQIDFSRHCPKHYVINLRESRLY